MLGVCCGNPHTPDDNSAGKKSQSAILEEFNQQLAQLEAQHRQQRQQLIEQVQDRQVQREQDRQGPSQSEILEEFNQQLAQVGRSTSTTTTTANT
ncbi:hypothetical protein ACJMK2_024685 [Sinanodonta woodiana]|uniref:Uncharacterized protein n=1 Tax=Sinanodonta woodiana TaxID=1069815 RepID=A0ABD3XE55_SINWO